MMLTDPLGPSLLLLALAFKAASVWHTQVLTVSWRGKEGSLPWSGGGVVVVVFCVVLFNWEEAVVRLLVILYVYLFKKKRHHPSPW